MKLFEARILKEELKLQEEFANQVVAKKVKPNEKDVEVKQIYRKEQEEAYKIY